MKNAIRIAALAAVMCVMTARASLAVPLIPLIYENGPNAGNPFTSGALDFVVVAYDVGTTYASLGAVGTTAGNTGNPATVDYTDGITDLDGLPKVNAPGASTTNGLYDAVTGDGRREDTWGVGQVTAIRDADGWNVWTPGGKGAELTLMFYGEQDFFIQQVATNEQVIDGVGLRADFYYDSTPDFNQTLGTSGRTGDATYTNVTDGTKVLSASSVPGFINDTGEFGGLATEFQSQFKTGATNAGSGSAFFSLVDPSTTDYERFNTNWLTSLDPSTYPNADLQISWNLKLNTPSGTNNWLVVADGPVGAFVPEPSSMVLFLVGAAAVIGCFRTKRRA